MFVALVAFDIGSGRVREFMLIVNKIDAKVAEHVR